MFNTKYEWFHLLILLVIVLIVGAKTTTSSSRSSYSSTTYRSYSSGSSGSAKCVMSTTMWIVVPIVVIVSFIILFAIITIIIRWCIRNANKRAIARDYENQRRICEEAKKKKEVEEATKLTKLHLEIEEDSLNQMYATNQSAFTIAPTDSNQQNNVIVPGTSVQPSYIDVNPYSGHHNNNIVPVVYNPADYGVVYDKPLVFQPSIPTAPVVVPQSNPVPIYHNYPYSMTIPQPVHPQQYGQPLQANSYYA